MLRNAWPRLNALVNWVQGLKWLWKIWRFGEREIFWGMSKAVSFIKWVLIFIAVCSARPSRSKNVRTRSHDQVGWHADILMFPVIPAIFKRQSVKRRSAARSSGTDRSDRRESINSGCPIKDFGHDN